MHKPLWYSKEEMDYGTAARAFIEQEIAPHVAVMDSEDKFPFELLKKLGKNHFIGVRFPEEYGGAGRSLLYETIANEQVGRASISLACSRSCVSYVAHAINLHGTKEQKSKYLPPMFKGEWLASECTSEASAGSDAAGMKTTATKVGDYYSLKGEKRFQANGGVANVLLVFAITNTAVNPREGMSAFLLEKGCKGLRTARLFQTMGYRGIEVVSEMVFKNVKATKANLLGEEGDGWKILMSVLDSERVIVSAAFIGAAQACLEIALKYSNERIAFKHPIRDFQGINFKIADMTTTVESARMLCIQAARMIDGGVKATKEAAMSKLAATEGAVRVISDAMQILGGNGCTSKYPVERQFRDARCGLLTGGSSEIMRVVIQREAYDEFLGKRSRQRNHQ